MGGAVCGAVWGKYEGACGASVVVGVWWVCGGHAVGGGRVVRPRLLLLRHRLLLLEDRRRRARVSHWHQLAAAHAATQPTRRGVEPLLFLELLSRDGVAALARPLRQVELILAQRARSAAIRPRHLPVHLPVHLHLEVS